MQLFRDSQMLKEIVLLYLEKQRDRLSLICAFPSLFSAQEVSDEMLDVLLSQVESVASPNTANDALQKIRLPARP